MLLAKWSCAIRRTERSPIVLDSTKQSPVPLTRAGTASAQKFLAGRAELTWVRDVHVQRNVQRDLTHASSSAIAISSSSSASMPASKLAAQSAARSSDSRY